MRAIIMDTDRKQAVAMSEDGMIRHIRNRGYEIGQSIEIGEMNMMKMKSRPRNLVAGIAAAVLITAGGGTVFAYNNPVAEVSVDVNPSIVYTVNTFEKVIKAKAIDDEAVPVLDTIQWSGEDLDKVLDNTIQALKEKEFLDQNDWYENGIVIGVHADSEKKEKQLIRGISERLEQIIFEETSKEVDLDEENGPVIGIGEERVREAARLSEELKMEITPGKLNLIQKLEKSYESIGDASSAEAAVEYWIDKPVKDIMAQVKENRQAEKEDEKTPPGLVDKATPSGLTNKATPPGLMKKEEMKESGKASE